MLFSLLLALFLSCGRDQAESDPEKIILATPLDEPALEFAALNPGIEFRRIMIASQVRRAIPLPPGRELKLPTPAGRLKFFAGIVPEYFRRNSSPVTLKLTAKGRTGEKVIWSRALSSKDTGWARVEIDTSEKFGSIALSSDANDYGLAISVPSHAVASDPRPSVVLILVDALRADHLGAYGYDRDTSPEIDALASQGAVFGSALTASPFTVTSLASIFTGLEPWEHRVIFTSNLVMDNRLVTLAQKLRSQGYNTAGLSSTYFHLSDFRADRGFDFFDQACDKKFFDGDAECLSDKAVEWIAGQKGAGPFFLYLHYTAPHAPYRPPEQYRGLFSQGLPKPRGETGRGEIGAYGENRKWWQFFARPTRPTIDWLMSQYDAEIRYSDEQIGRVLRALEDAGVRQNSLIIITADHGEAFYEHKEMDHTEELHWQVARVPLVLAGAKIPAGKIIRDLVRTKDIAPSILDYLGAPLSESSGQSFIPMLSGVQMPAREGYAVNFLAGKKYQIGAIVYPWHLLIDQPRGKNIELYDFVADEGETNDLSGQRPEVVKELRSRLPDPEMVLSGGGTARPGLSKETEQRLKSLRYLH